MVKEIPLISNKYTGKVALVDDEDYEKLIKYKWYVRYHNHNFYAWRYEYDKIKKRNVLILMARFILQACKGVEVDHKNHNELDNRKYNLRECSRSENQRNSRGKIYGKRHKTSKYKGVSFKGKWGGNRKRPWRAVIYVNGKDILIGHFKTELEAALSYDDAARKYYEDFAYTNFKHLTKDNLYANVEKLRKLEKEKKG